MSPSVSGMLQRKKYFLIVDKDEEHPKKAFYDVICYELIKDDPFYHELRYVSQPFFTGLVKFESEPGKTHMLPFKFWKRNLREQIKENILRGIDPTDFRHFVLNAQFIVIGNHLNSPQGYEMKNYQIIDTDIHDVQKHQREEYLNDLKPIYDYCSSIQYKKFRNYLFCHSCTLQRQYSLISEETRYKNQAFYVCRTCAGKEVVASLKKKTEITATLKIYLRDLLKKYRDVNKVINVFSPNFNILDHREATLVGVRKKKITHKKVKPQTVYDFDIPIPLRRFYEQEGKTRLLPAQIMAVEHGLFEGQDELIISSTSSGKTMIGELAGFSKILQDKMAILKKNGIKNPFHDDILYDPKNPPKPKPLKLSPKEASYVQQLLKTKSQARMLYLVPIVALANMRHREYKDFKKIGITSALKVGVSHISRGGRSKSKFGSFQSADIVIATYEAIDIILRSAHPYFLKGFRTIVVDEIQVLADDERGYILDGLVARLRHYLPRSQMLYLSATISDPQHLAKHLRSALILYQDRPVPIERHLVMCMDENAKMKHLRSLVREEFKLKSSFGFRGQSIVFTNSRKNTERLAEFLSDNHIRSYAYHGGLEHGQRKFVEKSFAMQKIACVVTTAALAAGVDFPASQVIFFNLTMGIAWITVAEFEQMSGRAGRLKKHDMGKVYMLIIPGKTYTGAQSDTEEKVSMRLIKGKIEPLELEPNEGAQHASVLATVSMYSVDKDPKKGISLDDLSYYHTLLFNGDFDLTYTLTYLTSHKFIIPVNFDRKQGFRTSRFGKAVAESFFTLEDANRIRKALIMPVTEEFSGYGMIELAQSLNKFKNVYVTARMLRDMSLKSQRQARSNNLFSNSILGMIGADNLGKKKGRHSKRLFEVILKWSEEIFNCTCADSPYCDCARLNVEGYILDWRLAGMSVMEIMATLGDEYEIHVFHGDLIDYLESMIYSLLAIQKIGRALKIPAQTMRKIHNIPKTVFRLIGPRKTDHH